MKTRREFIKNSVGMGAGLHQCGIGIRARVPDCSRAILNKIGEKCKAAGLKFGYHNHHFEVKKVDGQVPMEILLNETDADKAACECLTQAALA